MQILKLFRNALVLIALLCAGAKSEAAELIGGDSIGSNSLFTDFLGGFVAMQGGLDTFGQPAVEISQDGLSLLDSMRVIVHGHEALGTGYLAFNFFDYRLKVWRKADYLAGLGPQLHAVLGEPLGITLMEQGPGYIVPNEVFGEASFDPDSFSRPSYDFRFDLTTATIHGFPSTLAFTAPLPAGQYIIAFQSHHNAENGGIYVSLSTAGIGLTPYYHQDNQQANEHPRGILLGQTEPYEYRWGWNIFQSVLIPGDYSQNGVVDAADYTVWRDNVGAAAGTLENDIDGGVIGTAQYATWVANFGNSGAGAVGAVPEPASVALALIVLLVSLGSELIKRSLSL